MVASREKRQLFLMQLFQKQIPIGIQIFSNGELVIGIDIEKLGQFVEQVVAI